MTPKKPKREKGAPGTKRTKPKRKKPEPQLALFAPRQENLFESGGVLPAAPKEPMP